jgi:hypothetical protein
MSKIKSIEINFAVPVEPPKDFYRQLDDLLKTVCDKYKKENPGRVMWVSEYGSKMLINPFLVDDRHTIEFGDYIYFVGVSEREKY